MADETVETCSDAVTRRFAGSSSRVYKLIGDIRGYSTYDALSENLKTEWITRSLNGMSVISATGTITVDFRGRTESWISLEDTLVLGRMIRVLLLNNKSGLMRW